MTEQSKPFHIDREEQERKMFDLAMEARTAVEVDAYMMMHEGRELWKLEVIVMGSKDSVSCLADVVQHYAMAQDNAVKLETFGTFGSWPAVGATTYRAVHVGLGKLDVQCQQCLRCTTILEAEFKQLVACPFCGRRVDKSTPEHGRVGA